MGRVFPISLFLTRRSKHHSGIEAAKTEGAKIVDIGPNFERRAAAIENGEF